MKITEATQCDRIKTRINAVDDRIEQKLKDYPEYDNDKDRKTFLHLNLQELRTLNKEYKAWHCKF